MTLTCFPPSTTYPSKIVPIWFDLKEVAKYVARVYCNIPRTLAAFR